MSLPDETLKSLESGIHKRRELTFLATHDTKHWTDDQLLVFIRDCLRTKGSWVHDALEPIIERRANELLTENERVIRFLCKGAVKSPPPVTEKDAEGSE